MRICGIDHRLVSGKRQLSACCSPINISFIYNEDQGRAEARTTATAAEVRPRVNALESPRLVASSWCLPFDGFGQT